MNEIMGDRWTVDSADFQIFRGRYASGEIYLEFYQNKLNKLDSCKYYYKNGQVEKEGVMTNARHIYVGIWKYYSSAGEIDSVVNYDTKDAISYFKAIEIAKTKQFQMPDITVSEITYKSKKYWQMAGPWKLNSGDKFATAEVILIDKLTGEIVKPDFVLRATF